ncbi:CLUMA_CG010072, isoform A [Clunio marinus]|uniref:CLUMA_CG010072, isoform A n=1 Tax=Clunio marinus TaxID=568069 RepID=A0A1J1IBB4_9DIPT|nr:CLUMA_CG010072, isoform A [Clunio marinus]
MHKLNRNERRNETENENFPSTRWNV